VPFGPSHASDEDIALVRDHYRRLLTRVGEPDGDERQLDALSAGERALYVLMTAADLVGRGGFEQFLYFAPGLAAVAPDAAQLVTARRLQAVFERANAIAFDEPPRKRGRSEFRRMIRAVEVDSERLARLDAEFDALMADRSTRAEAFLARYIEHAPHDFADPDA
jgi:hypothetical protein